MTDELSVAEETEAIDPFALFPDEINEAVQGLTYLGQLSKEVKFCGHSFGLRTLLPHEQLAIGVILQPYRNTMVEVDAYQMAHIAMALTAVDGDEGFCPPIGPDVETQARARLNWVTGRWYGPTLKFLWSQYALLEAEAMRAVIELDHLSQGSRPTNLPPWLDSWIDKGSSPDETTTDTPPSIPSK